MLELKHFFRSSEIIGLDFSLQGKTWGQTGSPWGTCLIWRGLGGAGQRQETGGPSQGTHPCCQEVRVCGADIGTGACLKTEAPGGNS